MRANELVKENGIEKCKRILDDLTEQGHNWDFYKELKRLVESHELVESKGGIELSKKEVRQRSIVRWVDPEVERLREAIADVESCQ